eukprot:6542448-Pyramimonas_sp.AAC.1
MCALPSLSPSCRQLMLASLRRARPPVRTLLSSPLVPATARMWCSYRLFPGPGSRRSDACALA